LPRTVRKGIRIGPRSVRALPRAMNRKKTLPQTIFNNPRSSIKPRSAPDPTESIIFGFCDHMKREVHRAQTRVVIPFPG